ncbi:Respiratory supercomplex factor 2-like protein [Smittium culicis]|uniref:Respiratory supercomplex factor 2-like protein n=1 Tax=Smittium culicis TaxID=133412 RepID=A0A1R1Y424_9FUNG|nr:Respiratory supercomplex factor 2-like protein [Smittium culicis]OMJ21590.1 Respiratory supercomplex factor 2-like protein [Smittium culicis]
MVKVLSDEEEKRIDRFILTNTIYSTLLGVAVGGAASMLMHRFWPFYRRLPMGVKGSMVGSSAIAFMVVRTENQSVLYERVLYGAKDLEEENSAPLSIAKISAPGGAIDRSVDYFLENKYMALGAAWAAAAGFSVYKLYLNKNITWTQRIVQARMYAQALTVAGLIGVAAISKFAGDKKDKKIDEHSHH